MAAPSEICTKMAALLDRRGHLVEQLATEKNRLQNSEKFILKFIKSMINILEKEIAVIEKTIDKLITSDPQIKPHSEIWHSGKCVGKITAWTLLAYMSEIQHLSRNKLVVLAGIAPYNNDSGKFTGKRSIIGERAKVRKWLAQTKILARPRIPLVKSKK